MEVALEQSDLIPHTVCFPQLPGGKGVAAVRAIKTVGTTVLLQACLCRGHVLHAVGTVMRVHLMAYTETTPCKNSVDTREEQTMQQYLMSRQCLQKYNLHIGLKLPQLQRYCT